MKPIILQWSDIKAADSDEQMKRRKRPHMMKTISSSGQYLLFLCSSSCWPSVTGQRG